MFTSNITIFKYFSCVTYSQIIPIHNMISCIFHHVWIIGAKPQARTSLLWTICWYWNRWRHFETASQGSMTFGILYINMVTNKGTCNYCSLCKYVCWRYFVNTFCNIIIINTKNIYLFMLKLLNQFK